MKGNEMKKYTCCEALAIVAGTNKALRRGTADWMIYTISDSKISDSDSAPDYNYGGILRNKKLTGNEWWPDADSQKAEIWEIEPEVIYIWGVRDDDGSANIFKGEPIKKEGKWWENTSGGVYKIFPKDKPQKYKLIPVEED